MLALLSITGYKISWKKAQVCKQDVRYLGFIISEGRRALGHQRKLAICSLPRPNTKKGVREFLGAAGYCRIWIPGSFEIAKPLSGKDSLVWDSKQEKAFREIKKLLTSAPALRLPDVTRDFSLFVHEKNHTALGVLTTTSWAMATPNCIFVKMARSVAAGWPPCLRALAATVILVRQVDKLMLRKNVNVKVPHAVTALMNNQEHKWLIDARIIHYQGLLCENPRVYLETVRAVKPATFLPTEKGSPNHDHKEATSKVYSNRPDQTGVPL